ncbi:MAG: hypothetical protein DME19_14390 [Verrucomicrobia bacterium]|nr:MAG: hypothetical protein DME19_14390 [Verrucomicrobiota bacterium]
MALARWDAFVTLSLILTNTYFVGTPDHATVTIQDMDRSFVVPLGVAKVDDATIQLDRGARPPRLHGPAPSPTRPLPWFEALLKLRCAAPPASLAEHAESRALPIQPRCAGVGFDDSGRNSPVRRAIAKAHL